MPRQKRTSRILEKAQIRSSSLKAVDPKMDFGDTRNLQTLTQLIEELRTRIDAYNTALSVIDSSKTEIEKLEKTLADLTDKMLLGVAFKYGKDSVEYEMAGGVRKSERARRIRTGRLKAAVEKISDENSKTA
ncbi:hypothetical protein JYQ62_07500 [Nostoc sp. UHCC 0702]|nr:hypothetical protein JYQ62_07500 [Nostoc sp. UHCC 0702]